MVKTLYNTARNHVKRSMQHAVCEPSTAMASDPRSALCQAVVVKAVEDWRSLVRGNSVRLTSFQSLRDFFNGRECELYLDIAGTELRGPQILEILEEELERSGLRNAR